MSHSADSKDEWDPKHFRLFVGNLASTTTDEMLRDAFKKFPSLTKAKAIRDHVFDKCKGYGFVAFSDPQDYFQAFKTMNGKYIGIHPIQLKRAQSIVSKSKPSKKKPYKRK